MTSSLERGSPCSVEGQYLLGKGRPGGHSVKVVPSRMPTAGSGRFWVSPAM